ncbi:MAG: DUF3429 domain-containing protein, partial [Gammaproteobacteria bacterium]
MDRARGRAPHAAPSVPAKPARRQGERKSRLSDAVSKAPQATFDHRTRRTGARGAAALTACLHGMMAQATFDDLTRGAVITRLNTMAETVSYAGVAPFVLCLLGVGMLPGYEERELAQRIAIAYGAVVLAFAGAVHWGLALAGRLPWTPLRIGGAVLPALLGAAAAVLGGQRGLALLVVGFGSFWLYEHRS